MEDDVSNPFRRMLMRTRKIAPKMVVALASNDNKTQAAIARLEALENDYTGMETVEAVYDDEASLDDDGQQWDLQALLAVGISALFVSSLPIIHVRSVECVFVQSDARRYMMIPVA
uniref:Uncharacterized protein n=1 Tax=Salix viminalis TaxID=40686 RepID=A0A6N2N913_SALVM